MPFTPRSSFIEVPVHIVVLCCDLGMVYQPRIMDADNNEVFGMESARVSLLNVQDPEDEHIIVSSSVIDALSAMGIAVSGE